MTGYYTFGRNTGKGGHPACLPLLCLAPHPLPGVSRTWSGALLSRFAAKGAKAQSHSVGSGSHGWKMADPNLSPLTSHLLPCPLSTIFWAGRGQKKIRMKTQPKGRRGIRWLLAKKGQLRLQQGVGVFLVTRDPNSIKKPAP